VRGFEEELPPARVLTGDAIDGMLAAASSDQNLARTETLIASVTDTLVRTMAASLAESQTTPRLARVLGNDDVKDAVGAILYESSRQTTLGVQDAMEQISEQDRGIFGALSNLGWGVFVGLLAALFGTTIAVIVLAVKNRRRHEQLINDTREREQILTTLFSALASRDETLDEGARTALLRYLRVEPRDAAA
jgi:hypothetical protein